MKIKTLIIALMLAGSLYSQDEVRRIFLHDTVLNADFTRRYSCCSLAFKSPLCCDGDTIWVNVMSDSLSVDKMTLSLYAYFPRNINPINSTMLLNYEDGTSEILYQPGFPDENNYVEYWIATRQWNYISTKKVKSVTFRGVGTFKVKDKSFFINFYKKVI
jgi:hypothetical protein